MVVSAWTMHMTMVELFFGGWPHIHDLHIKMEFYPSKRVVEVEGHVIALNACHCGNGMALSRIHLHLHPNLKLFSTLALKTAQWHKVAHLIIILAICICRGYHGLDLITFRLAVKLCLQARDQIANTLYIGQRVTAFRAVKHLTFSISQGVVDIHHTMFLNRHYNLPFVG